MGLSQAEKERRARETRDLRAFEPKENQNYVFISYKSDNWEAVLDVVVRNMINRYGLRVYYDKNFDKDNDSWIDNMQAAIATGKCKAILSFVSKEYMKSYACLMELMTARTLSTEAKHGNQRLDIIPIVVNADSINGTTNTSSIPVTISEWKDYERIQQSFSRNPHTAKNESLQVATTVLEEAGDKVTEEEISVAAQAILCDRSHERAFQNTDSFYENLYTTISRISSDVFDESLKGSCVKEQSDSSVTVQAVPEVQVEEVVEVKKVEAVKDLEVVKEKEEGILTIPETDEILYFNGAKGKSNGLGGIIVLAGSEISKNEATSCPEGARKRRKEALEAGELIDRGSYYELKADKEFKSSSGAACFVGAYSVNGKVAWSDKSHKASEKGNTTVVRGNSSSVSSKIKQILMVVRKVQNMPTPINDYSKAVNQAAVEVAEELNIGKSSVIDKCQRQLGLSAMGFSKMLMDYIVRGDEELYNLVMKHVTNELEESEVKGAFGK